MDESGEEIGQGHEEIAATEAYQESRNRPKRIWVGFTQFMKKKSSYITITIIALLIASAGVSALVYTWDRHVIVEGVSISGVNVSNLSQEQAKASMDQEIQTLLDQTVSLNIGQQSIKVKLGDLGLSFSPDSALQEAYNISRTGSINSKVSAKMSAAKGISFNLSHTWDDKKLSAELSKRLASYITPAIDATLKITDQNTFNITKEQVGQTFDLDALAAAVKGVNVFSPGSEIKVGFKEQLPQVTAAQLDNQKITGLLSSYTTHFDPSQTARSENVRLAAKALDMAIIKPGDILSFNQIVGERTIAGGYKDAFIIVNGEFIPGLAGGICQVSTTLYNTGLLANLSVTQRANHALAISYAPLGQDATVAWPNLDLKFRNDTGGYLLIRTKLSYNTLTIELYGKVTPGQNVVITNTTKSVIPAPVQRLVDETMAPGSSVLKQKGQPGYSIESYRTVKVNGKVVKTEEIGASHYVPLPTVFDVGA